VIDPLVLHPNSVEYDDEAAQETLFALVTLASSCDLVIAYVPQASMGTALEMNAAYEKGVPVIAISPLRENWVIRAVATRVFPDLEEFVAYLDTLSEPSQLVDSTVAGR
jgi:nucleoside 2-deoxyribosyltransferase